MFSGTFEIVIIEIKPDKRISNMKFLYDSDSVTPKSESTINHNIPLSRAQIEAVYVLMEEYRNMSKTFFVQNCQKVMKRK